MKSNSSNDCLVYQFKIQLIGVSPPIWRRIQVPNDYTFEQFHVAIQEAMGWFSSHAYTFDMIDPKKNREVQIHDLLLMSGLDKQTNISAKKALISKYFTLNNQNALYTYDMGDSWEHSIKLERTCRMAHGFTYPRCITGKRACPPENSGGILGYKHMCKVLKDPKHKEYKEFKDWLKFVFEDVKDDDFEYDPNHFDKAEIEFSGPQSCMRWVFCGNN